MFAFLPLMMIGGTSGQFIRVLPTAVLVTVGASLLVALTIIPFLASRFLKEHEDPHGNRLLQWITGAHPSLLPAAAAPCAGAPEADGVGFARRLRRRDGRRRRPHRLQPVPEGGYAALPGHGARRRTAAAWPRRIVRCASSKTSCAGCRTSSRTSPTSGTATPRSTTTRSATRATAATRTCSSSWRSTTRPIRRERSTAAPRAGEVSERAHLRARVPATARRSPRRSRCASSARTWIDCNALAGKVEKVIEETPGARDVENPVRMRRTNLSLDIDSQKAALLGVPAVEFDRAVRLRGRGHSRGAFQGHRRRAIRHHGAHADRCTPRRARARSGARRDAQRRNLAAEPAGARGVHLRAHRDSSLQPGARRHHRRGRARAATTPIE